MTFHDPNAPACACCWTAFTPSVLLDSEGWPRCLRCAIENRPVKMPYFLRKYIDWRPVNPPEIVVIPFRPVSWTGHPDMLEDAA